MYSMLVTVFIVQISQTIQRTNTLKGVIFLFEGLDELFSLPEVTVVVTSRPWAVQKLLLLGSQFTRSVEILGFTKEDII